MLRWYRKTPINNFWLLSLLVNDTSSSSVVAQWLDLEPWTLDKENPGSNPVLPCQSLGNLFTPIPPVHQVV